MDHLLLIFQLMDLGLYILHLLADLLPLPVLNVNLDVLDLEVVLESVQAG